MAAEISDSTITIGSILGSLAVVGSSILYARRKLSRDSVEVTKDRAEIDILTALQTQRDEALAGKKKARSEAIQANIDKQAAMARVLQLELELAHLRQRVTLLKELVGRLSTALDLTKTQLSDIQARATQAQIPDRL